MNQPTLPPRFPIWRLVDHFGNEYHLTDVDVIESELGLCVRARYQVEGSMWERERGDFRLDTAQVFEPVREQMRMTTQEAA